MTGPFDLSGKTALVTEANTGLGQAIAVALARAGAALVGVGRSTMDETAHRCAEMGAAFQSIEADLATTEPIARILEAETRLTGRIDILINNDGIIRRPDVSMSPRPIGMR